MKLSQLSLSWKIALPTLVVFLLSAVIATVSLSELHSSMEKERLASLKHISSSAKAIAVSYYEKEQKGELTREKAQAGAKAAISAIRFDGGTGYVFVYDWDGTCVVLPTNKSLEGKNLIGLKDDNGIQIVAGLIEQAKNGGGALDYIWPKPGEDGLFAKSSWAEGLPAWQWMIGTGVYVDDLQTAFWKQASFILILSLVGLGLAAATSFVIIRSINRPIAKLVTNMGELADGNSDIRIEGGDRGDEVGDMARAMEVFVSNENARKSMMIEQQARQDDALRRGESVQRLCQDFDQTVSSMLSTVTGSAQSLQSASEAMNRTAQTTSSQSVQVAAASEEASANVEAVASAAEELAASVAEVARQVETSNDIALKASDEAASTNERVGRLAQSAKQISEVISLIQAIAEQTNLLALNATIEAARAGEAGKGFAVVASEVKELASQTSRATEEIDKQISQIQTDTNDAVSAIASIAETIQSLSGISSQIATAVDQQRLATQEIANNVTQASLGTQEVSANIVQVTEAARNTGETATSVNHSSEELKDQAAHLRDQVNNFLSSVKRESAA
ncbi:HAMP domain-containing protein [Cohaesibacter sp. CAU 1516]|uniref:methyl-accepting chemotaxis protein n=1 Tax=Cohaesibacter sp. CAU 1516 TaxID=2576038 RepID=UPI0010FD21B1|nr:cache domain-containing protein [Cohaesibacter sp. CAU 1516]TLP44933.1 HAMP domain-containing protein [Cohaesibacter sp. CAU 1516]